MSNPMRDALIEAVMQADGGPDNDDERWEAENMIDDILGTPAGRDLWNEHRAGQHAAAALRLVVMRHHADAADVAACPVCGPAIAGLEP